MISPVWDESEFPYAQLSAVAPYHLTIDKECYLFVDIAWCVGKRLGKISVNWATKRGRFSFFSARLDIPSAHFKFSPLFLLADEEKSFNKRKPVFERNRINLFFRFSNKKMKIEITFVLGDSLLNIKQDSQIYFSDADFVLFSGNCLLFSNRKRFWIKSQLFSGLYTA